MTKKLDPDIKAIAAVKRAVNGLPDEASRRRVLRWVASFVRDEGEKP